MRISDTATERNCDKMKHVKGMIISLFVISAIGITAFLCFKEDAANDPFINPKPAGGKVQGIDSLEKIKIGGVDQWIYITGKDASNPILLFLHGGPGYAMLPFLHENNRELEKHFTVVNWDQRGAGLSYSSKIPEESMTLKQFVSDTHELTSYLKDRFKQEKIYLMGHSFGTVLGMEVINMYPADYNSFVSIGQVVSFSENEKLCYDFALKSAIEANNKRAVKELTKIGRPDENGNYKNDSGYDITMEWLEYFGGSIYGEESSEVLEDYILSLPIYKDAHNKVERGWSFSNLLFEDKEVLSLDFKNTIKNVKVPVYFLSGTHDYETPFELIEEYFNIIKAPYKEMVWFENSAHFPFYEESQKFNEIMINKVLSDSVLSNLMGYWEGTYTTNQSKTKVTLNIQKNNEGSYWGEFSFETPGTVQGAISGSYNMVINYDFISNLITFTGNEWIDRPLGYEMVNMSGNLSGNSLEGSIYLQDSITYAGNFSVKKKSD